MSSATLMKARHLQLVRASHSAGEAFAPPVAEEAPPGRGVTLLMVWTALCLFAAAGLVLAA